MPTKTKPLPAPSAKGLREPQSITRQLATFFDPLTLSAVHWRRVVAQAPVVGACVDTLIMQITGLDWAIEAEDDALVEKYTLLLNMADNGAGFESLLSRVAEDALTVPFGGAFELGAYPDGEVAWVAHLDAGLMGPTYDEKFPYRQTNPYDALHPKVFGASEVSRVIWRPQTDIALYGWTKTPCMGCLPAIQGLLRSDRFWQTLLTDSPPAGILDIPGMSDQEARDWLDGWKTMMAGIDALKVPILTGEGRSDAKGTAQFISFGQDATQVQLPELVKRYSEQVCAVFGMNVADLGLFGQELRLAGATKLIELSKRQGLARLLKQFERAINNDVLPDGVTFVWEDVELEDTVRKAAAKNQTATALSTLTTSGAISPNIALAQAIADGIITVEVPEEMLNPPEAPPPAPAQAPPVAQEGAPKSDAGTTTSGQTKGEQAAARASPKAGAPLGRGDSTRRIPPRTYPANTPAGRNLAQVIGPAMRGVTNSFTKGRLGDLYDAALAAYTKALPAQRAGPADDAANATLDRLLAKADWWKTPNIEGKVVDALAQGYGDALHESAEEIQGALYHAGIASSAQVGFAAQAVADPNTLAEITVWGGDMIRNVDDGTKFYVKQKVLTGVKEGLGSPAIARTILVDGIRRGVVETFRGRTLSIVNTEMNKAMSQATLMQQQRVGLTKKVWHCVPALACDICAGNADQGPVPQDFMYEDVFDSGCTAPPAHPNVCNCWISFDQKELMDVAAPGGLPDYMTGAAEGEAPTAATGAGQLGDLRPGLPKTDFSPTLHEVQSEWLTGGTKDMREASAKILDTGIADGKNLDSIKAKMLLDEVAKGPQFDELYRGVEAAHASIPIEEFKVGESITMPLSSFTKNEEFARGWASVSRVGVAEKDPVVFVLRGAQGYDISASALAEEYGFASQEEVITAGRFRVTSLGEFAGGEDYAGGRVVYLELETPGAAVPQAGSLPIDQWTEQNYKAEFEARFGHQLVEIGEDPGWILSRAQTVANTIEPMPRCEPMKLYGGGERPLGFRMRRLDQIHADYPTYAAYYDPGYHQVVLPIDVFPGGPRDFQVSTMTELGEARTVSLAEEYTAHEYGHAMAQGKYGGWLPKVVGDPYAKMERLAALYDQKMAEIAAVGGDGEQYYAILPTHYSMHDAGEMLADAIAYARINPARLERAYPEIVDLLRLYFGYPP